MSTPRECKAVLALPEEVMLRAEARLIWLWGVEGWRWWYVQDFFRDTLEELKLVDASMLPPRIAGPRSTP